MTSKLHYSALSSLLLKILKILMAVRELKDFRLVGGTALSLYRGHRESLDIDLFTDAQYGSMDFDLIDAFLRSTFPYVDSNDYQILGPGKSYFVGNNKDECVKMDLFYTDKFIYEERFIEGIRMATVEEIIAMKIDLISKGGRKKDFWDIHELKDDYSIKEMLAIHKQRHPYTHDEDQIRSNFSNFQIADEDFEPICLKGKHWEIIKLDMIDFAKQETVI